MHAADARVMTGVRNGVLARRRLTFTTPQQLAKVPHGFTWLVKAVHVVNQGATSATVTVQANASDQVVYALFARLVLGPGETAAWTSWIALEQDDTLWATTSSVSVDVWVSGAELPGTRLS